MSVYVDPVTKSLRSKKWPYRELCHLFADTEEELHVFASGIGLKKAWFQPGDAMHVPHYDLVPNKRRMAIRRGAVELSRRDAVSKWRGLKPEVKT